MTGFTCMDNVCGIDPGYSVAAPGGIAFLRRQSIIVLPMPLMALPGHNQHTRHLRQCDLYTVAKVLREEKPAHVVIEVQGTRPAQNAGRGFKAAIHYGSLIGVVCALDLPYELVQPNVWKKDLGLIGADKGACLQRASHLMPAAARFWPRRRDHGMAEAALIAWWRFDDGTHSRNNPRSPHRRGHPSAS